MSEVCFSCCLTFPFFFLFFSFLFLDFQWSYEAIVAKKKKVMEVSFSPKKYLQQTMSCSSEWDLKKKKHIAKHCAVLGTAI